MLYINHVWSLNRPQRTLSYADLYMLSSKWPCHHTNAATTNPLPIWIDVAGMYRVIFYFSSYQERWYKSAMRREEVAMLMQGLTLLNSRPCTSSSLPPAMERPFSPPPSPVKPFEFFEPVDTCGQAHVCQKASDNMSSTPPPVSTIISVMSAPSSYYSSAGYHYTTCFDYCSSSSRSNSLHCPKNNWLVAQKGTGQGIP